MYHREFVIESTEVNASHDLKLASAFKILQDVATDGAEYIGIGTSVTYPRGFLWVISRMEIDVIRMPKYQQRIDVYTYPQKTVACFYPRQFVMKDMDGNILLKASSVWALIDKDTRRLVMKDQFPDIVGQSLEGELPRPANLHPVGNYPLLEERRIRYSDVDLNGHLNNTRYIEMIEDLTSGEEHAKHHLKHMAINYSRELHEGEVIALHGELGLDSKVEGYVGSDIAFIAELKYQ